MSFPTVSASSTSMARLPRAPSLLYCPLLSLSVYRDIVINLSGKLDFLRPNNCTYFNLSTVSCLLDISNLNMLMPWSLLSNMSIQISPGRSLDIMSIENSWYPNTMSVLPMDGLGSPSPNIYVCVDWEYQGFHLAVQMPFYLYRISVLLCL